VVIVCVIVVVPGLAVAARLADEVLAALHVETGYADARELELIGAVELAALRMEVGNGGLVPAPWLPPRRARRDPICLNR
jgi:hypothetical protein